MASLEVISTIEDDCCIENEYIKISLEYIDKVEDENKGLKENLQEVNDCIKNLKY
jgi:hypothetical protein